MSEEESKDIPHTRRWLELMHPVKNKVEAFGIEDELDKEILTEQLNIVEQMNHLLTYPYIREKYESGKLNILGWYYVIETGEVFNYDVKEKLFRKIE
jgi:carbonic anhydrase